MKTATAQKLEGLHIPEWAVPVEGGMHASGSALDICVQRVEQEKDDVITIIGVYVRPGGKEIRQYLINPINIKTHYLNTTTEKLAEIVEEAFEKHELRNEQIRNLTISKVSLDTIKTYGYVFPAYLNVQLQKALHPYKIPPVVFDFSHNKSSRSLEEDKVKDASDDPNPVKEIFKYVGSNAPKKDDR